MSRGPLADEGVHTLALLRIGIGLLLLWDVASTWRHGIELFSTAGPAVTLFTSLAAPQSTAPETGSLTPVSFPAGSPWWVPAPTLAVAGLSILGCAALAIVAGWQTRGSLLLALLLFVWLRPLDFSWTFAKHSVIWIHMLVLLALSGSGGWLAFDARQSHREGNPTDSSIPRRLLQLLLCQIYLGAAFTKLRSPWFTGGELLQFSLLDRGYGGTHWGRPWATSSVITRLLSLGTVLLELLFPFLVWVPRCRPFLLGLAAVFHLGIWAALNVSLFSPTMLLLLLAFLEPAHVRSALGRLRRWVSPAFRFPAFRFPGFRSAASSSAASTSPASPVIPPGRGWNSTLAWCLWLGVGGLCGVTLQRTYDWYGVFGNRTLPPLREASPANVEQILHDRRPALEEYVHRIALGTWRGGRDVFGDPQTVRIGETLYVQVQFIVPHPDLTLEGLLFAGDGRLAARFEHRLDAGYSQAINGFAIIEGFPLGKARLILQLDGFEAATREVNVRR